MVTVRVLEESDLSVLIATYPEPRRPFNRHVERFALQRTGDVTCLIAWDGDCPVGYVFARWPGHNGELTEPAIALGCVEFGDLFVHKDSRGRGIGRLLMESVETLAVERGYSLVGFEVTVSNPHNDIARALYERMAYEDAGLGEFVSGYTYWDEDGQLQRDEELHRYLIKRLSPVL